MEIPKNEETRIPPFSIHLRNSYLSKEKMPENIEYAPDCENVDVSKLKLPTQVFSEVESKSGEEDEEVVFHE